jgi:hypothetical protein
LPKSRIVVLDILWTQICIFYPSRGSVLENRPPILGNARSGIALTDREDLSCIEIMTGYDKLAELIGCYPGLAIYRGFSALGAKILLHMQAELTHLENELGIITQRNMSDPDKGRFNVSWEALNQATSEGAADLQRNLILKIQEKLTIYRMQVGCLGSGLPLADTL